MPRKKKGAKKTRLIAPLESRIRNEEKRVKNLTKLKNDTAKKLHAVTKELREYTNALAKVAESRDFMVRDKKKLANRKKTRAELKRAATPLRRESAKLAKQLEKADTQASRARAIVADILKKPIRERRTGGIRYRATDTHTLFIGGRDDEIDDESLPMGQDYAFRVADMMRSRRVLHSREYDIPLRHKAGSKKGALKFRGWKGGLQERNEKLFATFAGKEIDLTVSGQVIINGKKVKYKETRRILPQTYDDIVSAFQTVIRDFFGKYGSDVTYTIGEITYSVVATKRKGDKTKRATRGNAKRKGRVPAGKSGGKAKTGSRKNVGSRRGNNKSSAKRKPNGKKR